MARKDWGDGIGLHFTDDAEYFETLGYLTKEPSRVVTYTHKNDISGAWGGQGKLETKVNNNSLPNGLRRSFDLSGDTRLSVSDYVANLINNHSFTKFYDPTGKLYTFYRMPSSYTDVRATVPSSNLADFDRGYSM